MHHFCCRLSTFVGADFWWGVSLGCHSSLPDAVRVRGYMNDRQIPLVDAANLGSAIYCNIMQGPALQQHRHRQLGSFPHHKLERICITMLLDQRLEWLWGAPYSQGHRPSRVPGRAQTRDGPVASFLAAKKGIACSAPSTMGERFVVCGVRHFRRLVCATLIRGTASNMY